MRPVDAIGVGSCDDYIERYRTCLNSGNDSRADTNSPMRRVLRQEVRQWKADAKAGKTSQVAAACTEADKKARVEFSQGRLHDVLIRHACGTSSVRRRALPDLGAPEQ